MCTRMPLACESALVVWVLGFVEIYYVFFHPSSRGVRVRLEESPCAYVQEGSSDYRPVLIKDVSSRRVV